MRISIIFIMILYTISAFAFEEEGCKLIQSKSCVDYSERIIDGHLTSQCWKYEQKHICVGREKNYCQVFEDNRGCNEISGSCQKTSPLGSCEVFEKKFVCGVKLEAREETKHVDTDFIVTKDAKDLSGCSEHEISKSCEIADEICIEGPQTRNISGKDVHKDCWKWDRKYVCKVGSFVDECEELKSKCKEISKECLYINTKNGECDHFEVKYECSEQKTKTKDCIASKLCIGGVCKTSVRSKHNDFGSSISYLSILAGMKSTELEGCRCPDGKQTCEPGEIDPKSCKFFTGGSYECRNHTGEFNCCNEKGFLRQAFQCEQNEHDLNEKRKAKLCHHTGTWRGKKLEFFKKWQSHCCFKSKLAKIIQVQGRTQLGIGWGDRKNPDCRALNLEELKKIDFSKIDFSELFDEMEEKAKSKIESKKLEMKDKVEDYKSNSSSTKDMINKKISNFYGGAK